MAEQRQRHWRMDVELVAEAQLAARGRLAGEGRGLGALRAAPAPGPQPAGRAQRQAVLPAGGHLRRTAGRPRSAAGGCRSGRGRTRCIDHVRIGALPYPTRAPKAPGPRAPG